MSLPRFRRASAPNVSPSSGLQRRAVPLAGGLLAAALVGGCGWQPGVGELHHSLSEASLQKLRDEGLEGVAATQIRSTLDAFFGTPKEPRFMVTAEWLDEGFDPNYPTYAADDRGSGEFTDDELDALWADNEVRFADDLAAIERGDWAGVGPFRWAPILQSDWDGMLASHAAGDMTDDELREEGTTLLREYYPSLRDSAELYRQQCLHCHGVSGGADGPTAAFLSPRPRDYRQGKFKYTAIKDKQPPRRADLLNILTNGVYTTAMPSFKRFSLAERNGLVDMVRLLSIRGETEERLVLALIDEGTLTPEMAVEAYSDIWQRWLDAGEHVINYDGEVPHEATPAMLERGNELFHDAEKGNCASCHGPAGRGNGPSAVEYVPVTDLAGKVVLGEDGEPLTRPKTDEHGNWVALPTQNDDWGHPIVPRDLTRGVFRGGSRPIDIYRRIYAGINGTPMPGIGGSKDAEGNLVLDDQDMWSLVYYVLSLSADPHHLAMAGSGHGGETHDGAAPAEHGAPGGH